MDNETFATLCASKLAPKYDLVTIDYRDGLTREQVDSLVSGDMEALYDSTDEWLGEARREGADYYVRELVTETARELEGDDAFDVEDFLYSDECDTLRWAIEDRDQSNPIRDLAGSTSPVLMRQHVIGEDDAWSHEPLTATRVLTALSDLAEPGSRVPLSSHNVRVVLEALPEVSPEFSVVMGSIIYAVNPGDIYDLDSEWVEVVNPYLYLGNPFTGSGWVTEEALEGTFRIRRDKLTTDRTAWGYGWDEIAGVVVSYYDAQIRPVRDDDGNE